MQRVCLYALASCLTLLLLSCQPKPDYLIDEETMTDLLTDIHMSEGLLDMQQKVQKNEDDYGKQVMAAVLLKYNVSKADYDSSLVWYSQHLNTFIRIYKHVNNNLKDNEELWTTLAEASDAFGNSESGDSVNLWRQSPYLLMDEARLTHFRTWTFTADTAYHAGDTIRWSMHVPDLPEGEGLMASLSLLKQDGSSLVLLDGTTSRLAVNDTMLTLSCAPESNAVISQVVASLHLLKTDTTTWALRPCIVDELQMIRLHRK